MKEALVIHGIQNDLISPQGAQYLPGAIHIIQPINTLIQMIKDKSGLVICANFERPTDHTSFACTHQVDNYSWHNERIHYPENCVQNTWGAREHNLLDTKSVDIRLRSQTHAQDMSESAFDARDSETNETLQSILDRNKIHILHIVGLTREGAITATATHSIERGFNTHIYDRATTGRSSDYASNSGLITLKNQGLIIHA